MSRMLSQSFIVLFCVLLCFMGCIEGKWSVGSETSTRPSKMALGNSQKSSTFSPSSQMISSSSSIAISHEATNVKYDCNPVSWCGQTLVWNDYTIKCGAYTQPGLTGMTTTYLQCDNTQNYPEIVGINFYFFQRGQKAIQKQAMPLTGAKIFYWDLTASDLLPAFVSFSTSTFSTTQSFGQVSPCFPAGCCQTFADASHYGLEILQCQGDVGLLPGTQSAQDVVLLNVNFSPVNVSVVCVPAGDVGSGSPLPVNLVAFSTNLFSLGSLATVVSSTVCDTLYQLLIY